MIRRTLPTNMARVLVTAALGNVGREVTRECASRGSTVRAAGRSEAALRERFPDLEPARLDFCDEATWAPALRGCEYVFLLRPPALSDMKRTLNPFIDAAYAAGIQHLVFVSVAGAERMSWVPHRQVEAHLAQRGDPWTVLRPGFFAQNLQDAYHRDLLEDSRLYVPAGQGRVAFLDLRDLAEVTARIFVDPTPFRERALTLTGPEALTFEQVASTLTERLGRPIRYEPATLLGYARHLRSCRDLPWTQIVVQTVLHVGLARGDAELVDPTLEDVLGRRGRTLADYVSAAAALWRR